jgi:hypothetical protein
VITVFKQDDFPDGVSGDGIECFSGHKDKASEGYPDKSTPASVVLFCPDEID